MKNKRAPLFIAIITIAIGIYAQDNTTPGNSSPYAKTNSVPSNDKSHQETTTKDHVAKRKSATHTRKMDTNKKR
jgi:hypothetical protein